LAETSRQIEPHEEGGAQSAGEAGQREAPAPRDSLSQPETGRERRGEPVRLAGVDRGGEQERRHRYRQPRRRTPHGDVDAAEAQRERQCVHAIERRPVRHRRKGEQRKASDQGGRLIAREGVQDEADENPRSNGAEPRE